MTLAFRLHRLALLSLLMFQDGFKVRRSMLDVRCLALLSGLVLILHSGCRPSSPEPPQPSTLNPQPRTYWTNSLGLIFVPVPGTKVQFCIWETRVQDFEAFVNATGYDATKDVFSLTNGGWVQDGHNWKNPGFEQGPTHPVVAVSWADASAFCAWLTEKERKDGIIRTNQAYRLPTDVEWSAAIGLAKEDGGTPVEREQNAKSVLFVRSARRGIEKGNGNRWQDIYLKCEYPWGPMWPPPSGFGNYPEEFRVDPYVFTAPVAAFPANAVGLFDLSGNVWEWCVDLYDETSSWRAFRGGSFAGGLIFTFPSWARGYGEPNERYTDRGFRVVLAIIL